MAERLEYKVEWNGMDKMMASAGLMQQTNNETLLKTSMKHNHCVHLAYVARAIFAASTIFLNEGMTSSHLLVLRPQSGLT